ncbi:hypothetical protein C5167_035254 [Papaver somniferum]|uniref:Uncharacterized protein n=1 Tax=Papaver somniferum TaxID=3469 RepID=A0A4Y7KI56_PAPSO|nr:hypothetical protein C5167_035254 [Papaver somniferum]
MYNPNRVMRHLGYVQDSPDEDYVPLYNYKLKKCKADGKALAVFYEPELKTEHWNNRHEDERKVNISWWEFVNEGHEVTEDYMPWYESFSLGRMIRIDQTTGRRSNTTSSSASTADTRDDSTILKLVRERVKIFMKSFCCKADKGEVIEPEQSHMTRKTASQLRQERAEQGEGSKDDEQGGEDDSPPSGSPVQGPSKKSRKSSSQGSQRGRGGGGGRGRGGE